MFEVKPPVVMIPASFKMSRKDLEEWRLPGQIVIINKADLVEKLN
jgi:hypothetical protein